uniref:Uncharacterized protein n=1 Tax=Oryza brachyantha TaxID=4533 RepID=J3L065_ORYBR
MAFLDYFLPEIQDWMEQDQQYYKRQYDDNHWMSLTSWINGLRFLHCHVTSVMSKDTGSSSSDEEIEESYYGTEEANGASDMPEEVNSCVKFSADNIDRRCMTNQSDGKHKQQKCFNGACNMPTEIINSEELPPNNNFECSRSNKIDNVIVKPGGAQDHSNCQCWGIRFKRCKTSTEHLVEPLPDTITELEKVADKIRWVKNLLPSEDSGPLNAANPWKAQEKDALMKHR